FLRALHAEIKDERLTFTWSGDAPGMQTRNYDVKIFVHNSEKGSLRLKVSENRAPNRTLDLTVRNGIAEELSIAASSGSKPVTFTQSDTVTISFPKPDGAGSVQ